MKISIGRFLDRVFSVVAPQLAFNRARARLRFNAVDEFNAKHEKKLSWFQGAEKNRRNRDWRPKRGSADAAILSDFDMLLIRARSQMRDNWAASSIVKAFGRYVIGCGIVPVAVAKDSKGKERKAYNEKLDTLFVRWANRRRYCDVAQRQTYWATLRMAVEEMAGVGEHFIVWSYTPNPDTVGLRLQSFEPEQLDIIKIQNPVNMNWIRRGIEVDEHGAAVAYWFYKRPLNDYFGFQPAGITGSVFYDSIRVPAENVMHVASYERAWQTHGYTWLAASMNKLRDMVTCDDATLMTMKIESSFAITINREDADAGDAFSKSLPARNNTATDPPNGSDMGGSGDPNLPDNYSNDGGRQWAIEPAIIFDARPNEKISAIQKQTPGGQYEPFMKNNLRGAAAGASMSYDIAAKDFDAGTYSSKRQLALDDRRGFSMLQDLVIDEVCDVVWSLFVKFAILEDNIQPGRWGLGVTIEQFLADPHGWSEAEHIPDGFEWIDPAKEAASDSIAIDKRFTTRKDIIARRSGKNWRRVFQQIADEQDEAERIGITLPDVDPAPPASAGDAAPDDQEQNPNQPAPNNRNKKQRKNNSLTDRIVEAVLQEASSSNS